MLGVLQCLRLVECARGAEASIGVFSPAYAGNGWDFLLQNSEYKWSITIDFRKERFCRDGHDLVIIPPIPPVPLEVSGHIVPVVVVHVQKKWKTPCYDKGKTLN